MAEEILFEVLTPLNFTVRTTKQYWELITTVKHPVMKGKDDLVKRTIQQPDEIRRSKTDENCYLFYRSESSQRWTCAVTKRLHDVGFLVRLILPIR